MAGNFVSTRPLIVLAGFMVLASSRGQNSPTTGSPTQPENSPTAQSTQTSDGSKPATKGQDWNFHFQNTDVVQGDFGFHAKYGGPNSLSNKSQVQHTETADVYLGRRLWRGAELHVDGLSWEGFGLSQTIGIENFPSGEAYKYGTKNPYLEFARVFIRQTIGLGGPQEDVPDTSLSLAGKQDVSRVTLTAGRFTPTDVIDTNSYASSARTQFMNWGLINNGSWDYAADSVGFAPGFTAELNLPAWTLRYGYFLMPPIQNGFTGDDEFLMWPHEGSFGPIFNEWAMNSELERRYRVNGHPGTLRIEAWLNKANMANYDQATAILKAGGPEADWQADRSLRYKFGFGLNWEQEAVKNVGVFSRLGINDGREEAWAFTDAMWSASLGTSISGEAWKRDGDTLGIAALCSGASAAEQRFLAAGGLGILAGDGALNYSPETALETYYDAQLFKNGHLALDYQLVANPAFNSDRGPVNIFGIRFHYEF